MSICDESKLNTIDVTTVFKYREKIIVSRHAEDGAGSETSIYYDDEGDLVLPRKTRVENILRIEHSTYTDVDSVGLQVWNGAILLAEFIISENDRFKNSHVLELGAGTGFVSIIAAKYCADVTCTDLNNGTILETIERNFQNNRSLIQANYRIVPFDFSKEWSPEVETAVAKVDIIVASELIYDNEISENLVNTLVKILKDRQNVSVYFSVEKRYVFTRLNQRVEATHYEYFFNLLKQSFQSSLSKYELNQITNIPKYFYEYERCNNVELWCLSNC